MPRQRIYVETIEETVRVITRYLEDTGNGAHKAIYIEGWRGLAASAVLRAIAEHPPPSLREKFDKIIHIDCSMWKSRRALQRAIAEELKLPPRVMAILDRQDEEDDFSGVEEGSREEIQDVTRDIHQALQGYRCLVVFHNGSSNMVELSDFGIPRLEWFGSRILWTFRGRLRLNPEIKGKVDKSHLYLYDTFSYYGWKYLLKEEAREIARYTRRLGLTPEIAPECCSYMLLLNSRGGSIIDYNWAIHASNYWVCDGIIVQGGQDSEEAWDVATALQQELRLEDYSSSTLPSFGHRLSTPLNRWIFATDSMTVPPESTSFFLAAKSGPGHPLATLPNDMFHQSNKLRVLKLCRCTFNFSSPPFDCCHSLRFLGIDNCKDDEPQQEAPKLGKPDMGFFQSLWVLDICNTDWGNNVAWRRLRILRKLRIIEPTSSWETGQKDEFADMEKLELLNLSRNSSMQVLPSLSRAASLKTLVLDGCVRLEHVGPEGVPPSVESFSFDARAGGEHYIYRICLAGCAKLVNFKLRGPLPNLKELDISESAVQTLNLKDEVVHVPRLQQIILLGCKQLRSILWPKNGLAQLRILRSPRLYSNNIQQAVQQITPYLEDTSSRTTSIYFDGWSGLAASAVLRAIAEDPPPSLREKFDKIIHVDCWRWKSPRALQRTIAEELKLPQRVMAILDRQDEEDDFNGVPEGSRAHIEDVGAEIHQALEEYRCLAVFHNGSSNMIDLNDFGIPRPEWLGTRILWTFRGRLRLNPVIKEKVDKSHLYLYDTQSTHGWKYLLQEEAREIARYTGKLGVTPEIATECCSYMLSLNSQGGSIMDYNWAIHASSYWVCDGIIVQGDQDNEEAWDAATALHQELRLEDYSSSTLPSFGHRLGTPPNRWIFVTDSVTVPPESTSFFLAVKSGPDHPLATLPNDMFHQSDKLRVLKLCRCTFSFSSPPFDCCRNLRFLGIDSCKDDEPQEEAPKQGRPEMGFFQSLWVLDICNTDWGNNIAWRRLRILRRLRIIEPPSSWETGQKDEFTDLEKLELLDLSRNITIQVLPSLSRAVGLKTLVLDGCVELEHVGPEGVPPSLESFSFDARAGGEHNIYRICLAGCARLVNFKLRGPLPNLKELDISESAVQTLDLKDEVVHVPRLQQIILLGCKQLRSILWPKNGMTQLKILRSPRLYSNNIQQAVQQITPYLEDTSSGAHKAIYFDGWSGLAASAVLRAIAEDPPPSLREKFDKIIHVDCSRWKSPIAHQRAIAEVLKLPQRVMAILDHQDEEDDSNGVEEGSRAEIVDVTREIHRTLQDNRYLLVFHNGSNHTIVLNDFGVPRLEWFGSRILWTFRGRLRLNPEIKEKVDKSHLYLYDYGSTHGWKYLLQEEAREIARYTGKLGVTPEIATECCSYMLSLNSQGGSIMDYNWAIHASSYWVCDGIIVQAGQDSEEAWDAATALHQELRLEDYSPSTLPSFGHRLDNPPNRWIFVTNSVTVPPKSTSFFLAAESACDHPLVTLPNDMFHQSDKLRVLKLCRCTFNFSSPPFHCCRNLRFLGLDSCEDDEPQEEEPTQGRPEMEFFQSLWVLDICNTDWGNNIAWRRLQILRKLRIIEPTSSWETGQKDEFTDMEKLELLDLSRNITMQVLPSLSRAVGLKTLVLDGCVRLEHVGPEGVPPSLESFSFDARAGGEHNIYRICLAGCARLVNFKLRGPLPNLIELDISKSAVHTLDLKDEVVHVPRLQQITLLGCKQLRSILWPKNGLTQLRILRSPRLYSNNIEQAVQLITPYLEDTSSRTTSIYFDGWSGLAASAVLRAIAEEPPPSLREKFDKIIHIDYSRWKSPRALQRAITEELKLPQHVVSIFDRQDEEDDFSGVDEGSRVEIENVGREIHRALQEHGCLVVFHNRSNNIVDLYDFGIPRPELFNTRILWTFRGRLRLNPEIKEKVDKSHLYLYDTQSTHGWKYLLQEEAREIARYTGKLGITPEMVAKCCSYILSLISQSGNIMDYNWAIHASNYWVCDGIIVQGGHANEQAWDASTALHQELRLEDYSSSILPSFGDELATPPKRWIFVTNSVTVPPESTSFFFAKCGPDHPLATLPNDMFHQSDKLRVLKLCCCTFNFSSPPFHCCRSLRFLGLDSCKNDEPQEEAPKQGRPEMGFFQSLWVLDICNTDWGNNINWRQLQILRKLRIIEPTSSWEIGQKDEFANMEKLELLDLSRNTTMQVLPSLSRAVGLKTLVLDGCVGLEHVRPEGVPPSLESFSLDARVGGDRNRQFNIYSICLAGCARLVNFKLRGPLPNLKELDISESAVRTLDLKVESVYVPSLQQVILLGCKQLRSILWPENGLQQLRILCIDNRVGKEVRNLSPGSFVHQLEQAYVAIMDMRFVRSLVLRSNRAFCWTTNGFNLFICISATSKGDDKLLIPKNPCWYPDVYIDDIITDHDDSSALQFPPLDCHVEIGEGISNNNVERVQMIEAIIFLMNRVESLHVHDNSSITTIIPERMMSTGEATICWSHLKRCRVERCPKLGTVFTTNYDKFCFEELETFWAADLLMAHCIWSKGRTVATKDYISFAKLRSIHLHSCPRLTFVLPLSWAAPYSYFPNLETLHIVYCGDLRQVFPVEPEFLNRIAAGHRKSVLRFPKLKRIYLHDLLSLQQICESKMSTPMLEMIWVRGCWGLRRLPAVSHRHRDSRPAVDCEKDWWEKLEWDGLEASHDPSLFKPRHSLYYKKALPRGSVLR